jgi:uncharacterized membrane-anchored protein
MMHRIAWVVMSVAVFAVLNGLTYQKEMIFRSGNTMLLELAPVDPRSLMQGDYMELSFATEHSVSVKDIQKSAHAAGKNPEFVRIDVDTDGVGHTVLWDAPYSSASGGSMRLRYDIDLYGALRLHPRSFMFQEGLAEQFATAKYGMFRYNEAGDALLVGLADAQKLPIPMR